MNECMVSEGHMHAQCYRKFATKLLLVCAIRFVAFSFGNLILFFFVKCTTMICSRSPCDLVSCCSSLVVKDRTLVRVRNKYTLTSYLGTT
jgi:hypothetical protein